MKTHRILPKWYTVKAQFHITIYSCQINNAASNRLRPRNETLFQMTGSERSHITLTGMSRRKSDHFQKAANRLRLFVSPQPQPNRDILTFCSMDRIKIRDIFTGQIRVHLIPQAQRWRYDDICGGDWIEIPFR